LSGKNGYREYNIIKYSEASTMFEQLPIFLCIGPFLIIIEVNPARQGKPSPSFGIPGNGNVDNKQYMQIKLIKID